MGLCFMPVLLFRFPVIFLGFCFIKMLLMSNILITVSLTVQVGITLARMLTLDGTWQSFVESFSRNAPYIMSTVSWVYW